MNFEETTLWERTSQLANGSYRIAEQLPRWETQVTSSQIRRAASSVYANFAEGWARSSDRESAHFSVIVLGSLSELRAHLMFCVIRRWIAPTAIDPLLREIDELRRIFGRIRAQLRKKSNANGPTN